MAYRYVELRNADTTTVEKTMVALDALIDRTTAEYEEACRHLEQSRRYWWIDDAGILKYLVVWQPRHVQSGR